MPQDNSDLDPLFYEAGQKYGINPFLLKSVAMAESGMNRKTPDSYQGAQGLMQIIPPTARALGVNDARDPAQAIPAAARYLAEGYDNTGSAAGAVMYYHGGPDQRQWGPKTQAYVGKVAGNYTTMKNQPDPYADIIKKYTGSSDTKPDASAPANAGAPSEDDIQALVQKYAPPAIAKASEGDNSGQESIRQSVADQAAGKVPAASSSPASLRGLDAAEAKALENLRALPENIAGDTATAYNAAKGMAWQGAANTTAFNPRDPSTWGTAALGVGQTALGGLGMGMAPLTGAVNTLVVDPVTNMTGSPAIGEKAGVVAGVAAPGLVSGAVNRLAAAASPSARAAAQLNPLVTSEGVARLQANPNLSLMDVNPAARNVAAGIAVNERAPAAQNIMGKAIAERQANAGSMVSGALDASLGAQPDVPALLANMKQIASANAQQGFGAALNGARNVNLNNMPLPYLEKINATAKSLADSDPNFTLLSQPEQMHRIQSELRNEASSLSNSASGSDRLAGKAVGNVRSQLVDRIDQATGGKFKPAQAKYADDMAVQGAFDKGQTIFQNSPRELENRPDFWREAVKGMAPAELDALKLGVRTAADGVINGIRGAAKTGGQIGDVPFNEAKLAVVLGPQEAKSLVTKLQDARDMAATNNEVVRGSMTQNKAQGLQASKVREPHGIDITSQFTLPLMVHAVGQNPLMTGLATGASAARFGAQQIGRLSDIGRANQMAEILSAPGMAGVNRLTAPVNPLIPYQVPLALGATNELTNPPIVRR